MLNAVFLELIQALFPVLSQPSRPALVAPEEVEALEFLKLVVGELGAVHALLVDPPAQGPLFCGTRVWPCCSAERIGEIEMAAMRTSCELFRVLG